MTRIVVGPFNRVEGDLEVRLEVVDGLVRQAHVTATMYRGFEQILPGREPMDALVVVPRICGICSVSQSVAAARALAALSGAEPPPNGRLAAELILATENLADHLTHFYLFFMPDFARPVYAGRPWHAAVAERFGEGRGSACRAATAARQRWMELMGTLGGRWPHTGSVMPGGSTRPIDAAERLRLRARVAEMRRFLEEQLFGAALEAIASLPDSAALAAWHGEDPRRGDLARFLTIADDVGLSALGRGPGRHLVYGPPGGVWDEVSGALAPLSPQAIREDTAHAWFAEGAPRHPDAGVTEPDADKPGAYSWNKAPRLDGRVVETGALSRQLVAGQPLLRDRVARDGGSSVATRVLARMVEAAQIIPRMERALDALVLREPFHRPVTLPDDGRSFGLAEAARGALGHWLEVRGGRLARYQIVAPTSWNFSPRDAAGTPGALESALVGTPVGEGEITPVAVQHVVRSFDPCMVCTVH